MATSIQDSSDRRKLAFIIGNGDYHRAENRLSKSVDNAKELSNLLRTIAFDVKTVCNLTKHQMITELIDFSKMVNDGDLILFYFSGHSCSVAGKNYLMPIDDNRIESNKDVDDFAVNIELILSRLVKRNQSYVNILILDCCKPYVLKGATRGTAMTEATGLQEMKAPDGTFIQFACGANQAVNNDLFFKHLLKNIAKKNVNVTDMFRRITDDVYQESNRKQRSWSMNKLSRHEHIYLNEQPPDFQLDEINPNEIQSMLKKQEELRNYYDNFPDIDEVTNRDGSNIQKAEAFTQSILSQKPSGDVSETNTACHIIYNLLGKESECLFFDSTKGMNMHDASRNLNDISLQDRPFILKLNNSDGLGNQKYKNDRQYDLRLIKTLDRMMEQNESNPITEDILERLSKVHNTNKKNIEFKLVYSGSLSVVYTVKDMATKIIKTLFGLSEKLKAQFEQFKAAKVHPLLFRPKFDISHFDIRGNKDFTSKAGTFEVGPPGRTKKYIQPAGWTRYGLKVRGTYKNDEWLHPFGDPGNWYRAYHGTGNATAADFGKSDAIFGKQYASVDAAASIHETGFRTARVAAYGPGVYCSPDPTFPESGYVAKVELDTKFGKKTFKLMLQVAVNPEGVKIAKNDIWVVENPENIRSYGILIKEASTYDKRRKSDD